ncbi:MAG: sugar ABC transporter ATP-binding protein [Synergistaceae bacterium]|jgi:ABC-type sugar transport system ATPase subunit|nr:sugar ABC transporter ATP-binding protein [Synergistaceae bacterium]
MSEFVLEMKNIDKRFLGVHALDNVNFSLKNGEIHAIIGENGAGKSTLMNILVGIYRPDGGEIVLNGISVSHNTPHEALRNGVGIVPQELNLVPEISVAENIFLGNERRKGPFRFMDWEATEELARSKLAEIGIDVDVKQKLGKLSPAFQQLVSIARTLSFDTRILVLDEPTASLTTTETTILFKILNRLKNEGKSIILITHHLEEVMRLCDNVTIMRDGKMVHTGPVKDLSFDRMIFYMVNRNIDKNKKECRTVEKKVILKVENYSRKREFNDVNFEIFKGEIFGIAGLVGAGRTELFNCIFGITKPHSGRLWFDGAELYVKCPSDAIEKGIGLVPEERRKMGLFPFLSVYENMMLPSYSISAKAGIIRYNTVFELAKKFTARLQVKMASIFSQIKNLSGGNQQKVIAARWMAKGVRLLILDEPTRGIDVNAKGEIHHIIKEMADSGVTVIIISSELEEVITLADRIMVMHEGSVKGFIEETETIKEEDILRIALQKG